MTSMTVPAVTSGVCRNTALLVSAAVTDVDTFAVAAAAVSPAFTRFGSYF